MPAPSIEKLLRILQLESQKYEDRAVTRGLASFVPAWRTESMRDPLAAPLIEDVAAALTAYSALADVESRKEALAALLDQLKRDAGAQVEQQTRPATELNRARTDAPRPNPIPQKQTGLRAPVTQISGIGPANAKLLENLNLFTIEDLLHHYPARYDDYSTLKKIRQLIYNEQVTVIVRVASAFRQRTKTSLFIVRVMLEDETGTMNATWFRDERSVESLLKQLPVGREIVVSGKVSEYAGRLTFQNPAFEDAERDWVTGGRIVPVYPLTEGLHPLLMRRVMNRVAEYWPQHVPEFLPATARHDSKLMALQEALREIHFPKNIQTLERARRRLAFDELFTLQMAILMQRDAWRGERAPELNFDPNALARLIAALPYTLTGAQQRAVDQLTGEIKTTLAMRRLLQGDVGAGKTVVAALAMALVASAGYQAALMAPTEILAEQHHKNLLRLFNSFGEKMAIAPIRSRLLTGSTKQAEKQKIYEELANGTTQIVIGTHALIQHGVQFAKLGFVVVDEQHRFGVEQRKALRQKGVDGLNPHTLFMTATPIPRTLALTMYGDLDNTVLDELPPGRQPIQTHWFASAERTRAYGFVQQQVAEGRQAFIICPLVEESDKVETKAAIEEHTRLQREVFPQLKLGLLHGRMKAKEKDAVMTAFAKNEIQVLVSTSVVEVGIDVPNATIMMIEGANRFGLSQLHQFRGRVGRGAHKSFCLLVADGASDVSDQRLQAIVSTQDGFKLAEKDLEIRGPGEFFGTRQSGEPELKLVGIGDRDLLEEARKQAEAVLAADAQLALPDHAELAKRIERFWSQRPAGDAS